MDREHEHFQEGAMVVSCANPFVRYILSVEQGPDEATWRKKDIRDFKSRVFGPRHFGVLRCPSVSFGARLCHFIFFGRYFVAWVEVSLECTSAVYATVRFHGHVREWAKVYGIQHFR